MRAFTSVAILAVFSCANAGTAIVPTDKLSNKHVAEQSAISKPFITPLLVVPLPYPPGLITAARSNPEALIFLKNGQAPVEYVFDIKHAANEKTSCGAKISYSDGQAAENVEVTAVMVQVSRSRSYSSAGTYTATLGGFGFNGLIPCGGTKADSVLVRNESSPQEVQQAVFGQNTLTNLTTLTLTQTKKSATIPAVLSWVLGGDGPLSQCKFTYELQSSSFTNVSVVYTTLLGPMDIGNINAPVGAATKKSTQVDTVNKIKSSAEHSLKSSTNLGMLNPGGYRLIIRSQKVINNPCTGEAKADFEMVKSLTLLQVPKGKLKGLVLAPSTLVAGSPNTLNWTLQAEGSLTHCKLQYELKSKVVTNAGIDYNSLMRPLELVSAGDQIAPGPGSENKVLQNKLDIGVYPEGVYRLIISAKNSVINTCVGEVGADFTLTKPANFEIIKPKISDVIINKP